jgi:hypothetical protein
MKIHILINLLILFNKKNSNSWLSSTGCHIHFEGFDAFGQEHPKEPGEQSSQAQLL